jgi:hypothetical protein
VNSFPVFRSRDDSGCGPDRNLAQQSAGLQGTSRPDPGKVTRGAQTKLAAITFPIPLANGRVHLSTTPRWCGCHDRAFSHLAELPARGRVERV